MTTDYLDLRGEVAALLEAGDRTAALARLAVWRSERHGEASRDQQVWVAQTYGLELHKAGQVEAATEELTEAYRLEPRDRDVAVVYGELLFRSGNKVDGVRVVRNLLRRHKETLDAKYLSVLYRFLGDYHRERGEFRKAANSFDESLLRDPKNLEAVSGMLGVIGEEPSDQAERTRRILMRRLTDPGARATVLMHHGDDVVTEDPKQALRLYDEALALTPGQPLLLRRKAGVLRDLGEVGEAGELFVALANSPQTSVEEKRQIVDDVRAMWKDADVGGRRLVPLLEAMLDFEPEQVDYFTTITQICVEEGDYKTLSRAYTRMIRRLQVLPPSDTTKRALPLLWRNIGEIYAVHLGREEDAIEALLVACRLNPEDTQIRRTLLGLLRTRPERSTDAVKIAKELLTLAPKSEERQEYVQFLVRAAKWDDALCWLRVLRAEGVWSEGFDDLYKRLHRKSLRLPELKLPKDMRHELLRPRTQSFAITTVLAIGQVVFRRLFANDLSFYGLTEKMALDLQRNTLFNSVFLGVARSINLNEMPRVYLSESARGMQPAILDSPALIVGLDMMSGRSEREIAFRVAQMLTITRPEYLLASTHEPVHLTRLLLLLANRVDPGIAVKEAADSARLRKELDRRLSPELEEHLSRAVKTIVEEKADASTEAWIRSADEEASRAGLLYCDDVETVIQGIAQNTLFDSVTDTQARVRSILDWAVSDEYLALRECLGLKRSR